MTSSPRYTHHKLASFLVILTLALSFVLPAYAQEAPVADEETASLPVEDQATEASQDGAADFEAAHNTGCLPDFLIDNPTNGSTVQGTGLIWGRGYDASNTGLGSGMDVYDLYRGETFIMTTAAGASRDPGHVRADLDAAVGKSDMRGGFIFNIDWSTQPGGNQTYRVLGRTPCEWVERTFTVNVNPAPPAPAASLSINDVSRTVGTSTGTTTICTQTNAFGQCTAYGTSGVGTGQVCVATNSLGQCTSYSTTTTGTISDLNFDFTVTLSPATTQTVTVDYATADGSAVQGTDYAQTSGTLSFAPGETSKTITVRVYGRNIVDTSDRDFFVRLSNARNASISDSEGRGRINRTLSGVSTVVSGGGTFLGTTDSLGQVTVLLNAVSGATSYRVVYSVGSTCTFVTTTSGSFTTTSFTVSGLSASTTYCFQGRAILSGGGEVVTGGSASGGVTTGTITVSSPTCTVSPSAATSCSFTVSTTASVLVSFTYQTVNVSATGIASSCGAVSNSSDYVIVGPLSGTITSASPLTVPVTICQHNASQPSETFQLSVTSVSGATPSSVTGTATIPAT